MNRVLHKLIFAVDITTGLSSLFRLLWNSKKLRWSKTGFIKASSGEACFSIHIEHSLGDRRLYLRTYAGDIDIFYEIFYKGSYAVAGRQKGPIKTVVDLGANVGLATLYFLQKYPQAQVICVEPEESNFKMLLKNLEPEIKQGKVTALQVAAMGQDGEVSFQSAEAKYNSRINSGGGDHTVSAISIPTLMERTGIAHIDLLKIDVEGAEKNIFSGNLDWLQKVDNVLIELHSEEDRIICMDALQRYNFTIEQVLVAETNEDLFWACRKK